MATPRSCRLSGRAGRTRRSRGRSAGASRRLERLPPPPNRAHPHTRSRPHSDPERAEADATPHLRGGVHLCGSDVVSAPVSEVVGDNGGCRLVKPSRLAVRVSRRGRRHHRHGKAHGHCGKSPSQRTVHTTPPRTLEPTVRRTPHTGQRLTSEAGPAVLAEWCLRVQAPSAPAVASTRQPAPRAWRGVEAPGPTREMVERHRFQVGPLEDGTTRGRELTPPGGHGPSGWVFPKRTRFDSAGSVRFVTPAGSSSNAAESGPHGCTLRQAPPLW